MIKSLYRIQRRTINLLALAALVYVAFTLMEGMDRIHAWNYYASHHCWSAPHGSALARICRNKQERLWPLGVTWFLNVFPYVFALISALMLATDGVIREIERRSVRLAWSASLSRREWLVLKVKFNLAALFATLTPVVLARNWFVVANAKMLPTMKDWSPVLDDFRLRALLPFGIAIAVFSVALFVGLYVRREFFTYAIALGICISIGSGGIQYWEKEIPTQVASYESTTQPTSENSWGLSAAPRDSHIVRSQVLPVTSFMAISQKVSDRNDSRLYSCIFKGSTKETWETIEGTCLGRLKLHLVDWYVPTSEFVTIQASLLVTFSLLALLLFALSLRKIALVRV